MLIIEAEQLTESSKDGQHWYIEGVFAQSEAVNKNRRIYKESILDREVAAFNEAYVKTGRAVGELSHPQHSEINPDRAAILITKMVKEGHDYIGKARVLGTPCGQIIQAMLEGGVTIGVSTRGSGTVKTRKDGISEVCEDFRLHTVDAVMNPSAPKAIVSAVYENVMDVMTKNDALYEEFKQFLIQRKAFRAEQRYKGTKAYEAAMVESFAKALNVLSGH